MYQHNIFFLRHSYYTIQHQCRDENLYIYVVQLAIIYRTTVNNVIKCEVTSKSVLVIEQNVTYANMGVFDIYCYCDSYRDSFDNNLLQKNKLWSSVTKYGLDGNFSLTNSVIWIQCKEQTNRLRQIILPSRQEF